MEAKLRKAIDDNLAERLDENITGIADALRTSAAGKVSVSIGIKLTITSDRIFVKGKVGYGPRFGSAGETSSERSDPNQKQLLKEE